LRDKNSHIGIDFDGTLAYSGTVVWDGPLGDPIMNAVELARKFIDLGIEVRIFTARVSPFNKDGSPQTRAGLNEIKNRIGDWTEKYIGKRLDSTNQKDHNTLFIIDDKCIQIIRDTGELVGGNYENFLNNR
jgi:hypothetical protein